MSSPLPAARFPCPRLAASRALTLATALAVLALAVTALPPASALAEQADQASTRIYVEANYRFVSAAGSRIGAMESALHGLVRQVRSECPLAAAKSPQNSDSEKLSDEVIGAMVLTGGRLVLPAARQFVSVAGGLRWSDPALTRTVHGYVEKLKTMMTLAVPKLCPDVQSWAASAFQALPASTPAFDALFLPNWVSAGELPAALARYETASERPLLQRSKHLESEVTEFEAREVESYAQILDGLVLQQ